MRLLVLGGTKFLGIHVVEAALGRGDEVTLFNRGETGADLFPAVSTLIGDRDDRFGGGLGALRAAVDGGARWDAVIDTSGYFPRQVGDSARLLAGATDRYAFVSSISVYSDTQTVGQDESAAVAVLDDPSVEDTGEGRYGGLKALCEDEVRGVFGERCLIVRPGLIVGPHDPSDRFTYWPVRFARGGRVLAPGPADEVTELIDARDLAVWLLESTERGVGGTFNASGPTAEKTRMGEVLAACERVAGAPSEVVWATAAELAAQGVTPWIELPLWVGGEMPGHATHDASRAIAGGLKFRPIEETIGDTLDWAQTRDADHEWQAGLAADREAAILATLES